MRHPTFEQALFKSGLQFDYIEKVPVKSINVTRGKQMQARLVPIDHNLVDEYAAMLNDGYTPPPLLLWKQTAKGLYIPLDGNQRLAANEQASPKHRLDAFSAYVVKSNDLMVIDRLCWQFNNMVNGRRLSYEECMDHAITFVRKYNQPIKQTAKEWGVREWELSGKVREGELRDLGNRNNIETKKIPPTVILELNSLGVVGEDLLLKAMRAVAESGISQEAVKELARDVSKAKTFQTKSRLVDDFVKCEKVLQSKAATKGGKVIVRRGRHPREQLQKQLGHLENLFDEYKDIAAFKPTNKADRERYSGSALFVANKLIAVYGLGPLVKGQGVK